MKWNAEKSRFCETENGLDHGIYRSIHQSMWTDREESLKPPNVALYPRHWHVPWLTELKPFCEMWWFGKLELLLRCNDLCSQRTVYMCSSNFSCSCCPGCCCRPNHRHRPRMDDETSQIQFHSTFLPESGLTIQFSGRVLWRGKYRLLIQKKGTVHVWHNSTGTFFFVVFFCRRFQCIF